MLNKKATWSWCFYDFANSAFATSILTFIFPFFFKDVLVGKGEAIFLFGVHWSSGAVYPILVSFSLLWVFLFIPILGKWADQRSCRKQILKVFWLLGSISTFLMFFLKQGDWAWGSLLFILANIGFAGGNVFYNALMKEVASDDASLAKLSGLGWAFGYLGGFLALVLQLILIMKADFFGLDTLLATRLSLLSTGVWWFVFGLPIFWGVQEKKQNSISEEVGLLESFRNVSEALKVPLLGAFLISFFLYNDAVQTTISQAGNLAGELVGLALEEVMAAGVVIQFVAILGSLLFLLLEKKFSTKTAVVFSLYQWILVMIWASFMHTKLEFYIICVWVGLIMGVTQSGSRTLFAALAPREKSASYFAIYTMTDRASAMLGPLLFAFFTQVFTMRWAILPLGLMVCLGTVLLKRIPLSKIRNEK